MLTSEVIIDEQRCKGCGYCVQFCPRGCMVITGDKVNRIGCKQAVFINPERCNTCGLCSRVCPYWAIEVNLRSQVDGAAESIQKVIGPPAVALSAPLVNCPSCQHPVVGRMIIEVLDELGVSDRAVALDAAGVKWFATDRGVTRLAEMVGGSGGGRPHMAMAGGKEVEKLDDALAGAPAVVESFLS